MQNVSMSSMDLFVQYLYREVLELVDLDWLSPAEGCQRYHIMPRFARSLPGQRQAWPGSTSPVAWKLNLGFSKKKDYLKVHQVWHNSNAVEDSGMSNGLEPV